MENLRALIVDDEPDIRMLLSIHLEIEGQFDQIDEAENGAVAIESARENHPDLVILDLMMPEVGGAEALPCIRHVSPGTKVAIYSAASAAELSELTGMGADLILGKDRDITEVVRALTLLATS